MKKILKNTEFEFGPYTTVELVGENYLCDNAILPAHVVGEVVIEEVPDDYVLAHVLVEQNTEYNNSQRKKRAAAYLTDSDPMFFKAQRGEATTEDWLAAVAAVKSRYPYKE